MGISTVASYTGAQVFEAIGLGQDLVDEYFTGTVSRLGGIGLDVMAEEVAARHRRAYPGRRRSAAHRRLELGGEYQWRREGEYHLFNPETVFKLQHATRTQPLRRLQGVHRAGRRPGREAGHLAGPVRVRFDGRPPVPIDEVEPVSRDRQALRHRRHVLRLDLEGGPRDPRHRHEPPRRQVQHRRGRRGRRPLPPTTNGDLRRSAIKQVASGRFGVTSEYLVNADDLQIKMAQGAKPGEGGQLPGHKVYPWIAKTRHSTPGVGLISPPPHHDIYSIEDLAQLIHDLKNANPRARVHVKLVAEVGVGTVAAGVSKAHADVVLISGHDGGTGASPLTSLKHAGAPWELGLAETQQTLLLNGLRDRIVVQTDGQLKTGRDVVIAALLGAEEFGFATAPLVVSGCVMMRVCHLDTCPVGVATQNPELRKRFTGKPEFVVNFFEFIAEEVREHLAALGFRSIRRRSATSRLLDTPRRSTTGRPTASTSRPILRAAESRRTGQTCSTSWPRTTASTRRPRRAPSSSAGGPGCRTGEPVPGSSCRSATSTAPSAPCSATRSPRVRRRGPARRHHRHHLHRLGRPELRRLRAAAASRCGSRATPTTTSARGSPAGASSCAPTAGARSPPRRTSSPAT